MLAVSGDEPEEGCRREATTPHECSCAAYQTHVQSHAATVPVSSDSKLHASQSQKVQTASLVSCHHHLTKQIYIRWCCIDLSNAPDLSGVASFSNFFQYNATRLLDTFLVARHGDRS